MTTTPIDLTKGPTPIAIHHANIMRNSYAHTFRALTITHSLFWQSNPPLMRDRGRIELACDYEHCSRCDTMRRAKRYDTAQGFGAGYVYFTTLDCGHQIIDDCSYAER